MATGHRRMAAALAIAFGAVMMTASTASAASFTITKKTEPAGDPASFNFTWEGVKQGDPNASMGSGDFTLTDGQSTTVTTRGAGFYTVKEQTPSGWKLVDIQCENGNDPDPKDATQIDLSGGSARIELSAEENKSCTFTNRKPGTLRIRKVTAPAGSTTPFTFDVSSSLGQPFSIADQGVQEYTVDPGTYQVTERATDGWTLAGAGCDDTDSSISGATVNANVAAGETVTCTFNNTQNQAAVTPPAPVVQPPGQGVLPRPELRPASARLVAPKRCVTRTYTVAVSGSPVRSVSFWVNGKRVRTIRAHTGQRRFSVTLGINRRVAKVRARVTFRNNATPSSRVLSATVRRCAPAAVKPQFTG
jgi:Prealbumin-like fold domain